MSSSDSSTTRRDFLKKAGTAVGAAAVHPRTSPRDWLAAQGPLVVASGNGIEAAERAVEVMQEGRSGLDGIIEGVNLVEEDPEDITVGYGGIPNAEGVVQLDAAVMHGPTHNAGSVGALEGIKYPSKVARLVMERTDHVHLMGEGAQEFAQMHGFEVEDLLTERARKRWVRWKETNTDRDDYLPPDEYGDDEMGTDLRELQRHYGTIHCSALDPDGDLHSVTTTSGLFFKVPGRVGDSPIIGAGLYLDNDVGAAGSTGRGEANLKNCSSFLIVERMRMGDSPEEACLYACRRIAENTLQPRLQDSQGRPDFNVRFYAISKKGEVGGAQMRGSRGQMVVADAEGARKVDVPALYEG